MAEQKDYITYVHEVYDYLHTIPELGFEEYKTSAFILSELKKCGFRDEDIVSGIAGTGILVTIDSGKPGPVLALRADIDALEFIINGERKIIHACGHDGHTAILLATAKILKKHESELADSSAPGCHIPSSAICIPAGRRKIVWCFKSD